ncbi:hypothetical protein ACOSP7_000463 [Xanthoceras sorbifolium]
MEVNNNRSVGHKPEKKKPQLINLYVGGGGGGIGGLVLLGGGLAVAAFVAAFAVIKNKRTRRNEKNEEPTTTPHDNEKRDATSPGLSFVLQTPPTTANQNSGCPSHEPSTIGVTVTQIDSSELVSTRHQQLEDKPMPAIITDGIENPGTSNQEILLADDASEESITSSYHILTTEEFSLPAPDGVSLDETENTVKNESVESFQSTETIEVKKEDEAVDAEVLAGEENLPVHLVEEEEDDDVDVNEENVIEKEEENSEGILAVEENWPLQEILLSDDSDQDSTASGDDILSTEDSSLAVPDGPCLDEAENMINDGFGENLQFTETIDVLKEEEAVNTDKLTVEENSLVQSVEDHEDNSCEEQVTEKEEENSEGKLAVKENLVMQLFEKEAEEDSSKEHASEIVEEGSQGKLAIEDNSATQPVEEEDYDDDKPDDDDNGNAVDSSEEVTEEEEESSEGTGSSSMESNVEAIWPAEMLDAPPQELKEMNANYQNTVDKIVDEDRIAKDDDYVDCKSDGKNDSEALGRNNETTENSRIMLNKKAPRELVTVKDQIVNSTKWQIWIWSILVLLLLLLLLHIHQTAIPQDLPHHDSVIVP